MEGRAKPTFRGRRVVGNSRSSHTFTEVSTQIQIHGRGGTATCPENGENVFSGRGRTNATLREGSNPHNIRKVAEQTHLQGRGGAGKYSGGQRQAHLHKGGEATRSSGERRAWHIFKERSDGCGLEGRGRTTGLSGETRGRHVFRGNTERLSGEECLCGLL